MAIRVRCKYCRKKISIDDAFAGGVCRCPYCRALVFVPVGSEAETGAAVRPQAPTGRPSSPEELEAVAKAKGQEHIPLATPVKIQGIVTIVLIGVLLLMGIATAIMVVVTRDGGNGEPEGPTDFTEGPIVNPFKKDPAVEGAWVAGNVPIVSPVIYVIDGGDTMKDLYDFSGAIARLSIRNLSEGDSFTILLSRDVGEKDEFMDERYRTGANERAARKFLSQHTCRGLSDLPRALKAALAREPKTIVLFSAKPVDDVIDLAKEAAGKGVRFVAVTMGDQPGTRQSMIKLARATKGHFRWYVESNLNDYAIPLLD